MNFFESTVPISSAILVWNVRLPVCQREKIQSGQLYLNNHNIIFLLNVILQHILKLLYETNFIFFCSPHICLSYLELIRQQNNSDQVFNKVSLYFFSLYKLFINFFCGFGSATMNKNDCLSHLSCTKPSTNYYFVHILKCY